MEEQLQQKLKEVKAKIKTNSKDAHFADALIDELVGDEFDMKGLSEFKSLLSGE